MRSPDASKRESGPMEYYSISEAEFKKSPTTIDKYVPGEKVTRENFTNFLILSFAVSRGNASLQEAFFYWIHLVTGLMPAVTIAHLIDAGGWEALSEEEKVAFRVAFDKVAIHSEKFSPGQHEFTIATEIAKIGAANASGADMAKLEKVKSFQEFSAFSKEFLLDFNKKRQNPSF